MKKNYYVVGLIAGAISLVSFSSLDSVSKVERFNKNFHAQLNSSGSPGNFTGAPGDQTCASCHGAGTQSGANMNTVTILDGASPVTDYVPGTTYNVVILMNTNNVKNGFQIVPLTSGNAMAGTITITDGTNTKSTVSGGKTRVTHKLPGTALNSWTFQWTAPATNVGTVTFYLATNLTNNNSNDGAGDVVYISQHTIGSTAGVVTNGQEISTEAAFNKNTNSIQLEINTAVAGEAAVNVVDLNGKSVQFEKLGSMESGKNETNVRLSNELPAGMYVVHVNVNNNYTSKKIYITK